MATPWSVPPLWTGRTVAIIASGPSMSRDQAKAVHDAGIATIAINDNGVDVVRNGVLVPAMAPWADMLYAADAQWWQSHPVALKFAGLKVTTSATCAYPEVLLLKTSGAEGFDPDPSKVRTGGNSGYQALHIAIHAKAARILLCGFDMNTVHGHHWFGKHQRPLRNTDVETLSKWPARFKAFVGRAEIINCTPGSSLNIFPKARLEQAIERVSQD